MVAETDIRSAASVWALAGYPTTGATQIGNAAAPQHKTMTFAAARKDDARVPPRGRPL